MLFQCESRHLGDISLNHPARYTGGTRGRPVLSRGPGGSWRVAAVPRGTDSPGERKISSSRPEAHARLDPISARNLRRLPWAHALGAAPPVCQPDVTRGPPTPPALQSLPALTDTWLSCQGPGHTAPRATRRRNPEAILACPPRAATWVDPGAGLREPSVAFHPGYSDATPDGSHQGPEAGTVSEGSSRSC